MGYANGKLPATAIRDIPGGRLATSAADSWLRLRAEIAKQAGIYIAPTSSRCSYRTYAEQEWFWNEYQAGRGSLAARPGTSAHGAGMAVDVATPAMAAAINKHGAPFGWQKKWSDAPSEWWHFRYASDRDSRRFTPAKTVHHLRGMLTSSEKYYRDVLTRHRRAAKRAGGWGNVSDETSSQAVDAKRWLRQRASEINAEAGRTGWSIANRADRFKYIKEIVNGGS